MSSRPSSVPYTASLSTSSTGPRLTPEALLDGLNDVRPHVVHFSGHAGDAAVLFDNGSVESPEGHEVPFELLARALGATAEPPTLLILNGCDTLDGAEVLLEATPVVIAMATEISDLAASAFAARFYAAVASAQPIGPALRQGTVVLDLMGLDEGWKPNLFFRADVAVTTWSWCRSPIEWQPPVRSLHLGFPTDTIRGHRFSSPMGHQANEHPARHD